MGRRTAATVVWLPPGGLSSGDAPPIFFSVLPEKKTGRARSKRKGRLARFGAVALRAHGSRRIGACADLGWPSGTLWPSASLQLPSRGGWRGGCRGARTHLTSFSFRAFRFATRCLGGCRGRCPHRPVAEVPSTTGSAAATAQPLAALPLTDAAYPLRVKSVQWVSQTSPGQRFPQGQRVSVPDCRKGLPTFPRRRQEVRIYADRPAEALFLFHRARRIFCLMFLCGAPAAPRAVGGGGARERAQFSPQAETEHSGLCDDDNGGRICPAIFMAVSPRPIGRTPITPCENRNLPLFVDHERNSCYARSRDTGIQRLRHH